MAARARFEPAILWTKGRIIKAKTFIGSGNKKRQLLPPVLQPRTDMSQSLHSDVAFTKDDCFAVEPTDSKKLFDFLEREQFNVKQRSNISTHCLQHSIKHTHYAVHLPITVQQSGTHAMSCINSCSNWVFRRDLFAEASILPKPMMHIASFPLFPQNLFGSITFFAPPYYDHDALMHHALYVLDAPASCPSD